MTRALSNDLRERVVEAVGAGESCRVAASRFCAAVFLGGELVAALPFHGVGGTWQGGRAPQARSGTASDLHRGEGQSDLLSDAAGRKTIAAANEIMPPPEF
jgi:hypothetical protein